MIGVLANSDEEEIVREFFELFKTPWEFCKTGQSYEVIVCTRNASPPSNAKLVLHYSSKRTSFDAENNVSVEWRYEPATFSCEGQTLPLYGQSATFPMNSLCLPRVDAEQKSLTFLSKAGQGLIVRIGYNLFEETRLLLTVGQPAENAGCPTLEVHIQLLRNLITRSGISLIEVPPIPAGYDFTACLTHDLDHPVLRNHFMDHTMFGFVYRATLGSVLEFLQGKRQIRKVWRNWIAVCRLPFVYLGLAKDPWREFDRYLQMEAGRGATYFVITRKGYAGKETGGKSPIRRAARYSVGDIKHELERILSRDCEVALHGIDAWIDVASGKREQEALSSVLGEAAKELGVRMHWLYFDENSPARLDQAGFSYDSTLGYRETVGFRTGTTQAYKPLGTVRLLELPLNIMDTALFYPCYMNLNEGEAERVVSGLVTKVEQFGGVVTFNWHDRSIASERLWDEFYHKLLGELERRGAWLPTASRAVSWFRKRRSAVIKVSPIINGEVRVQARGIARDGLPALRLRIHKPSQPSLFEPVVGTLRADYVDMPLDDSVEQTIAL